MSEANEVAASAEKKDNGQLIVQSKVRELIRTNEMRASEEFIAALSAHVHASVLQAVKRAKDNGRATLRPADL